MAVNQHELDIELMKNLAFGIKIFEVTQEEFEEISKLDGYLGNNIYKGIKLIVKGECGNGAV